MVKVVIDGNRLVMEHAQVLEHKCRYTDAETQLNHRCWNTDAGTQMLKHRHKCCNKGDDEDGVKDCH
jgi:hypothetical protein